MKSSSKTTFFYEFFDGDTGKDLELLINRMDRIDRQSYLVN
jgi:hypothetical protein